ncbi:MAG: sigma-54 dependent transcriptional regulator [Campylobacterota bacterium]|nr:sigma-54 dependent transcriptional regulator [Campylobacterota bacterium]
MKLAIVEDDINMRKSLEIAFSDFDEYEVVSFKNAKDALKKLDSTFDLIVTDINMPGIDGIEFIKELDSKFEVIVMTGNATLTRAIESIQLGVKDFLLKPFEIETLVDAIKRSNKIQKVTSSKSQKSTKKSENVGFIATSPKLEVSLKLASKAAASDATIMLLGESGVGKEVFASYIHKNSTRNGKPFIAINMAAIPENLIESELFGFEKGAFTDAQAAKSGLFEQANGGTLFLDEIAEMPFSLQAKLLRALQEREVQRLGSSKKIKIDVRVVSATNANIEEKIENSEFREDLYYRLNTIPINIPPLRERVEEILPIAEAILDENIKKYNFEKKFFNEDAKAQLLEYRWPGNIRELISVVERSVILSDSDVIDSDVLFLQSRGLKKKKRSINDMEKELIEEILNEHDVDEASKLLGMSKAALNKKIKLYDL